MKRYNHIYEHIWSMDNLVRAFHNAKKDKTHYKAVQEVKEHLDEYLYELQDQLMNKTYQVGQYTFSTIVDKGKERELAKLPFYPDRVVQWAIMQQIEDIFVNSFCPFVCASLKGRGSKKVGKLMRKYLKDVEGTKYCLKIDVSKFYPSIDKKILKKLLQQKFKDKDLLWLLNLYIDSYPKEKGLPIGSYLSQYLANFYLSYFDHWLYDELGYKYVIRYMDDVVIFSDSKEDLHQLRKDIEEYWKTKLNLTLKPNWQVFPVDSRGVDFIGYKFYHYGKIRLRKRTVKRLKRKIKNIKRRKYMSKSDFGAIVSYSGILKNANCRGLRDATIGDDEILHKVSRYIVDQKGLKSMNKREQDKAAHLLFNLMTNTKEK